MEHKTTTLKPLNLEGAASVKNSSAQGESSPVSLPQITPVWVEQTARWGQEGWPEPQVLSRKSIRWMW